jgi:Holliday junction DNA helicase RuvA
MFAYIKGLVAAIDQDCLILDNQGIGYRIFIPSSVADQLSVGDEAKIYTHFAVREDAMQLYGFLTRDDLDLYEMLLTVSGIGPKGAMGILSVMGADDVRFAVLSDDAAAIAKAPGVGKKTAQTVIIELKDKLDLKAAFDKKTAHTEAAASVAGPSSVQSEAVLALSALGYSNSEALRAVRKAAPDHEGADTEELIKAALKELI